MAYRLVENKGDSVAVPQLVIAKLPELEDDWLRVALFVVATGETDPARIAAALRLKSPERAQTALVYWKGAGLLESCGEPQARGGIDAAPAPRACGCARRSGSFSSSSSCRPFSRTSPSCS